MSRRKDEAGQYRRPFKPFLLKKLCRICGFPIRPNRASEHSACEVKALADLRRSGTRPGKGDAR